MIKDGEDSYGLQTDELEKFRVNFSRCRNLDAAPLMWRRLWTIMQTTEASVFTHWKNSSSRQKLASGSCCIVKRYSHEKIFLRLANARIYLGGNGYENVASDRKRKIFQRKFSSSGAILLRRFIRQLRQRYLQFGANLLIDFTGNMASYEFARSKTERKTKSLYFHDFSR